MWVKALELEPDWIQVRCGTLPLARHSPGDSDDDYDDDDSEYDDDDYNHKWLLTVPLVSFAINEDFHFCLKTIHLFPEFLETHRSETQPTRQGVLNNIVKEVLNAVTRIVGWGLTTLVRGGKTTLQVHNYRWQSICVRPPTPNFGNAKI